VECIKTVNDIEVRHTVCFVINVVVTLQYTIIWLMSVYYDAYI